MLLMQLNMVTSKILLIEECKAKNIPIICSMGTGNKMNPTMFEVADISKTSGLSTWLKL